MKRRMRFLLVGPTGSGKTTLAGTAPGTKLFLDYSAQVEASFPLHRFGKDVFFEVLTDPIPDDTLQPSQYSPEAWPRHIEIMRSIAKGEPPTLTMMGEQVKMPKLPDIVIIDELTAWQEALKFHRRYEREMMFKNMAVGDLGRIMDIMYAHINQAKRIPCHFMVIAHEGPVRDEMTGKQKSEVVIIGKNRGNSLGGYFTEVWKLRPVQTITKEGLSTTKRILQLASKGDDFAKTKLKGMPQSLFVELGKQTITAMLNKSAAVEAEEEKPKSEEKKKE